MASIIKADNIQKVSDGTNIIKKCGSTITLGSCGATIALACGASQTGFGRTGTVDWCTTAKTAPFTGVSGKGYFVNTSCGAVTVTLPATPTAGDIISVKDYAGTFNTNSLTLCRNSSKIDGGCLNACISTKNQVATLVYVDGTQGWKTTDASSESLAATYITATGGTVTTCGDYKIHTFTSDGCFSVTAGSGSLAKVDYLVIAGGAGGAWDGGGGGGAGGFRESHTVPVSGCYTASPLASCTSLPVSIQTYPITVGAGGAAVTSSGVQANSGSPSTFDTITSAGGGGGSGGGFAATAGGSGGGAKANYPTGAAGNTPPTTPPQGNPGGNAPGSGAGGGGAGAAGSNGSPVPGPGGNGGAGATTSIDGTPTTRAGGGGGGGDQCGVSGGTGGSGGGGNGGSRPSTAVAPSGTANTGSGGGGAGVPGSGGSGAGGSGIVIIRYKFQ